MLRTVLALTTLIAFTSHAFAGQAIFTATGTVGSASVSSGPFVGTTVGSPVTLKFEVNVPGTPVSASQTNYAIDQPTFLVTIGANSTGLNAPATCGMYNADPLVDRIILGSAPLVGGGGVSFSFTSVNGSVFNSTDPLTNIGTWSGNFYSVYSFAVQGPGVFIDVNFQTFSISQPSTGTPSCFGDGSSAACPCGNFSVAGSNSGCLSSIGLGGRLTGSGAASVGADAFALNATQMPNGPGLFFQGSMLQSGGAGFSFGDGLLCAGGAIVRLGVVFASGNASSYPGGLTPAPISIGGACLPGDVRYYQIWYRDASTTFCSPSVFNFTNALAVTWGS
jgi:hypothetical protein